MTTVLIVEGDLYLGDSLKRMLNERGYSVNWAKDRYQAVDELEAFHFDVLISDFEFPGGDGIDVIKFAHTNTFFDVLDTDPPDMTILWSGLDRTEEVAKRDAGKYIDAVLLKGQIDDLLNLLPPA